MDKRGLSSERDREDRAGECGLDGDAFVLSPGLLPGTGSEWWTLKHRQSTYLSIVIFLTFALTLFNFFYAFGEALLDYFRPAMGSAPLHLLIDFNYLLLLWLLFVLYRRWRNEVTRRVSNEGTLMSLQKAVETMQIGVTITDPAGNILYVNSADAAMHGYKVKDLIGQHSRVFAPPELWRDGREPLINRFRRETVNARKDGTVFPVQLMSDVVTNTQGGVFAIITTCEDITERKKLEEQLRHSQKLEAVGLLAGGIAHDFSNVLTTIKGSTYLLQKKLQNDSQSMKYAEQIVSSINKATTLSQGLLAFSRKQTITLEPTDMNELVRKMGKLLSQVIGENIEVTVLLTDETPTVLADCNQMEQVLMNLVNNARDAMPGGGRLILRTDTMTMDETFLRERGYGVPGEYLIVSVSDTGIGIEGHIKEKIFEPFFTTKAVGKGTGLGLAVTYGIVKQHNGFVDVESTPGKGSTFMIYIPRARMAVPEVPAPEVPPSEGGTETILLTEDDEDTRRTMSEVLRVNGYRVLEACDGDSALSIFRTNRDNIDLVFLDVRMPKKNGREVREEIIKDRPDTRFLFMSGYTADIMDGHGTGKEGGNFISKAAMPEEILNKVREVLDIR